MDVVLVHPDIPWNTGNIGRTCVAADAHLHLIKPMGFEIRDKWVRRAGLDYWDHLHLTIHDSLRTFLKNDVKDRPLLFFSRFAKRSVWDVPISDDAVLIFGSETEGLPKTVKTKYRDRLFRIPTTGEVRSLNLSTAVGIVLFEAMRQQRTKEDKKPPFIVGPRKNRRSAPRLA